MNIQPITLTGKTIRLEPLTVEHIPDLTIAGRHPSIWTYMLYGTIQTQEQMEVWVADMLHRQSKGSDLPFSVIHLGSGKAIGATRYMEISRQHRQVEIGGTWYAVEHQRTRVNTECKLLLLQHAFEVYGCIRVQLKTDLRNERSQLAIERLGAVKEGVLRNHMITPEGVIRHSVYYSILDIEWPAVKARLEGMLRANQPSP
jgi:N-acetyltransferase